MLRVTLRSFWEHKRRLVSTVIAIVLGVAFMAGTLVLTDTLDKVFDDLFADEPTGNLDSRSGTEILTFMKKAVDELGQSIVMVTHDPVAAAYADRVVFLVDGRIVSELQDPSSGHVLDQMKALGGT